MAYYASSRDSSDVMSVPSRKGSDVISILFMAA
jgi:hypothetical protein